MAQQSRILPSVRPNVPMPPEKFENYAIIGAKASGIDEGPAVDDMDALLNYLDSKFLIYLVNARTQVADSIASRFSECSTVAQMMHEHDSSGEFTYQTLDQEFDAMIALPNNYLGIDSEVTILFVGLFSFLNRGDDVIDLRDSFLGHLSTVLSQGEVFGMANFIVPSILWFTHYQGYEERVIEEYTKLKREKAEKEAEQLSARYRSQGVCQHCGGTFKGLFSKVCSKCGRSKDY